MISVFSVTKAESLISISLANINSFCNKYSVFSLKEEGKSKRSRGGDTPAVSKNKIFTILGYPGADSGDEGKSKRAENIYME